MIKNFKNQKGFTIIELLLYMGIFSILMFVLFQLLSTSFDVQLTSQSAASISRDGRFILNKLDYDIKKAKSITTPTLGAHNQKLVYSDGIKTFTYEITNGNLNLTVNPGTTDQLNSIDTKISNLDFLRLADINGLNDTVSISFTISSRIQKRGATASANLKTTAGIR